MGESYNIDGHKLDFHIDRVYEWKIRGETTPIYVELSPTASCNHHCTFCALDYANHTNIHIPRQKLINIGDELAKLGVRGVMFGGEGEPTLHPNLPEVIAHYHKVGIDTALTTNGALLGPEFATRGGEFLTWVKVSMNGGDPEAYKKVHGVDQFEATWRRIAEFRTACRHNAPTVGVQAVMLRENIASLHRLCERAAAEKVDYVVLKPFSPNPLSPGNKSVTPPCLPDIESAIKDCKVYETPTTPIVTRDCATRSLQDLQDRLDKYDRCMAVPFFWLYINSHAEVIACSNHMTDPRFNLGSLYSKTLLDIWFSYSGEKRETLKGVMRSFDVSQCRKACRMDRVNEWLWRISHPGKHSSFI